MCSNFWLAVKPTNPSSQFSQAITSHFPHLRPPFLPRALSAWPFLITSKHLHMPELWDHPYNRLYASVYCSVCLLCACRVASHSHWSRSRHFPLALTPSTLFKMSQCIVFSVLILLPRCQISNWVMLSSPRCSSVVRVLSGITFPQFKKINNAKKQLLSRRVVTQFVCLNQWLDVKMLQTLHLWY